MINPESRKGRRVYHGKFPITEDKCRMFVIFTVAISRGSYDIYHDAR